METQTLVLSGGRKVVVAPFTITVDFELIRPFVVLLPAANAADCSLAEEILASLIQRGCIELCCVGAFAEQMHDQLDATIERLGDLNVATTWFDDKSDACEYFLFAAGGGSSSLLALIMTQPDLVDILINTSQ